MQLPTFLYQLAKSGRQLADQFYVEALNAYGAAPMDQFLYLSSYPFANKRDAGEMPGYTFYVIPEGFEPNSALQRLFVRALLARIEGAMDTPAQETHLFSDHEQMRLALNRLETQVQSDLPEFADAFAQAKDKLFALLTPNA